jgi:GTP-binding protein
MIPSDSKDIRESYDVLLDELRRYNPEMLDKQRFVAISKCDLLDEELRDELTAQLKEELPVPFMLISAIAQQGLMELKDKLWLALQD